MEVKIRLQRIGKAAKGRRNYRIVAISKARARDGRHLEILGHYESDKNPAAISIDHEKLEKWIKNGAQMSDTVKSLVKKTKKQ
ncbi:MAG: 30S ribosomal protein S16 [Candidatus Zapsychrus exili]|nr:30S ribosomal protein S16 [Candidatus Zapsychrus exili]